MTAKEYFKITRAILPRFTTNYPIFMMILTLIFMIISNLANTSSVGWLYLIFMNYAIFFMTIIFPMNGPSPSVKNSLSSNVKARKLQGGCSSNTYDMFCVMPITRQQIVSYFMVIFRMFIWICSVIEIISLLAIPSSEIAFTAIISIGYPMIFIIMLSAQMTTLEKPATILTIAVFIGILVLSFLISWKNISISFFTPTISIIFIIATNIINEIIMRATLLNPKRYYARNGRRIKETLNKSSQEAKKSF